MDALGGRMILESSKGAGTKITLIIPYAATNEQEPLAVDANSTTPTQTLVSPPAASTQETKGSAKTRVLLVDDHAMLRQGLRTVLEGYADIEVVGEATNGEQALMLAKSLQPEVVVMDVNMPGMDGIEATRRLKLEQPVTIVIGLSVHNNWQVEDVMREAGAVSFLAKDAAIEQLHATIQQALRSGDRVR